MTDYEDFSAGGRLLDKHNPYCDEVEEKEEYWMRKRCPTCWDMSVCDPYDPEATCLNCSNLLFAYLSEEE